jgi:hypothetical protein
MVNKNDFDGGGTSNGGGDDQTENIRLKRGQSYDLRGSDVGRTVIAERVEEPPKKGLMDTFGSIMPMILLFGMMKGGSMFGGGDDDDE